AVAESLQAELRTGVARRGHGTVSAGAVAMPQCLPISIGLAQGRSALLSVPPSCRDEDGLVAVRKGPAPRKVVLLLPESLMPCGRGRRLRRKRHIPEQVTRVSHPLWNGDSSR